LYIWANPLQALRVQKKHCGGRDPLQTMHKSALFPPPSAIRHAGGAPEGGLRGATKSAIITHAGFIITRAFSCSRCTRLYAFLAFEGNLTPLGCVLGGFLRRFSEHFVPRRRILHPPPAICHRAAPHYTVCAGIIFIAGV
jgi:hypothetical protein